MRERVSEVMSRDVCTVSPDWDLTEIARLMRDENIGAVPVAEESFRLSRIAIPALRQRSHDIPTV